MSPTVEQYEADVVDAADANRLWVDAERCEHPTARFKEEIAHAIIQWLREKNRTIEGVDGEDVLIVTIHCTAESPEDAVSITPLWEMATLNWSA